VIQVVTHASRPTYNVHITGKVLDLRSQHELLILKKNGFSWWVIQVEKLGSSHVAYSKVGPSKCNFTQHDWTIIANRHIANSNINRVDQNYVVSHFRCIACRCMYVVALSCLGSG